MKKNKGFTIIGYWGDNAQPYMEYVKGAKTVREALETLKNNIDTENNLNGWTSTADNLWIVEVVEGKVDGIGGLDSTSRLVDLLED